MNRSRHWNRREIMNLLGMGMVGAATVPVTSLNAYAMKPEASPIYRSRGGSKLYQLPSELSTAALLKGNDRSENIYKALKLIENQVLSGIKGI